MNNIFTKPTSPMDIVTQKTPEKNQIHLPDARTTPTKNNLSQSVLPDPPHCSGKKQRAPVQDNDSQHLVTSYGRQKTYISSGKEREK